MFVNKLENFSDGTFSIEEVKNSVRGGDNHEPITQLVCIGNFRYFNRMKFNANVFKI